MSELKGQRPASSASPDAHADREIALPGGSVAADREWAQNRIANFFRAQQQRPIMRKAANAPAPIVAAPTAQLQRSPDGKAKHQADSSHERAKKHVENADQPLEPGSPTKSQHGHGHGDHGFETTMEQQKHRVETGETPSGRKQPDGSDPPAPDSAGKFFSAAHEAEALLAARADLAKKLSAGTVAATTPSGKPARSRSIVFTSRKEGFGQSAVVDPSAATRTAVADKAVLRRAFVVFEYVPSLGAGTNPASWRPLTYYPTK